MIILTIDTDWAPEEATRAVLGRVRDLGVKCTVFFSTPQPDLYDGEAALSWPLLEEGCHPDLSRRTMICDQGRPLINSVEGRPDGRDDDFFGMASLEEDQGVDRDEARILGAYRRAFPRATAVRTHRFYWHSDLSRNMAATGFIHDSSLIMPFHPGLTGFKVGRLHRWPVWSSDHLHLARRLPLDRLEMPNLDKPGLKIFCFHVAYLYLNASSLDDFNMIRQRLKGEKVERERPAGPGIWDLFEMLAERIYKRSKGWWLSDLEPEFLIPQRCQT